MPARKLLRLAIDYVRQIRDGLSTSAPRREPEGDAGLVRKSGLFDSAYYLRRYPDARHAGVEPLTHFLQEGWRKGCDPSPNFSVRLYLAYHFGGTPDNPDVINPLVHYLRYGRAEGLAGDVERVLVASGFFDPTGYVERYPQVVASGLAPMEHFLTVGWRNGCNPNAAFDVELFVNYAFGKILGDADDRLLAAILHRYRTEPAALIDVGAWIQSSGMFDENYYLAHHATAIPAGVEPLQHFLTKGWRMGCNPSAQFNVRRYLAYHYGTVPESPLAMNPLLHYLRFGRDEGLAGDVSAAIVADGVFDESFYLQSYPEVSESALSPIEHFLTVGWRNGCNPNATFDVELFANYAFCKRVDQLDDAAIIQMVKRFSEEPAVRVDVSALVGASGLYDEAYYAAGCPEAQTWPAGPLDHFLKVGWRQGRNPSATFDVRLYLAFHYGVSVDDPSAINPLIHYLRYGEAEGLASDVRQVILSSGFFDENYYVEQHPQVAMSGIAPLQHFLAVGWRTGCNPNATFDLALSANYVFCKHVDQLDDAAIMQMVKRFLEDPAARVDVRALVRASGLFDEAYYTAGCPEAQTWPAGPLDHFLKVGWRRGHNPSAPFDVGLYLAYHYGASVDDPVVINPVIHYLRYGESEGLASDVHQVILSSGFFDENYYVEHHPEATKSGLTPLQHFLTVGWRAGCNPNADFDVALFANYEFCKSLEQLDDAAIMHMVKRFLEAPASRVDVRAIVRASGLFDDAFYRLRYPEGETWPGGPLDHFLKVGWRKGCIPSAKFDVRLYLAYHYGADLDDRSVINPLLHFLRYGKAEGLRSDVYQAIMDSGFFDERYYVDHHPEVSGSGLAPLEHFLTTGWRSGCNPNANFDVELFVNYFHCTDLSQASDRALKSLIHCLGRDRDALISVKTLVRESGLFDERYYLERYPEVHTSDLDPLSHFLKVGWRKQYDPSEDFSVSNYLARHFGTTVFDATVINPLVHFLSQGRTEGLSIVPVDGRRRISKPPFSPFFATGPLEDLAGEIAFVPHSAPELSIVVATYGGVKYTLECLKSITLYPPDRPFEVIVVDDASPDGSGDLLEAVAGLRLIRNPTNLGYIGTANRGGFAANGTYLLFLNNDAQVTDGCLDAMLAAIESDPEIGLVGPKILFPDGTLQEAGCRINRDGTAKMVGLWESYDDRKYGFRREVEYCSGAALLTRRETFVEVDGFDEVYAPAYCDDSDFAFRLRERGYRVFVEPDAILFHHLGSSYFAEKSELAERNCAIFLKKWQHQIDELSKVRVIAFYLPQYHPIPENDRWWGEGFTEWTSVRRAKPNFDGHYQPRVPAELGYYDLRDDEVRKAQSRLAKDYGIDAFCYYHYWFSGEKLLETPIESLLRNREIQHNFCICWANESWTRTWDGQEHNVLIEQSYAPGWELDFIKDIGRFIRDDRYLRVHNRPLLLIYRAGKIPNCQSALSCWRRYGRDELGTELSILSVDSFLDATAQDHLSLGFDGIVEFPPHGLSFEIDKAALSPASGFAGRVYDYEKTVSRYANRSIEYTAKTFRTVMPGWDNTARRQDTGAIVVGSSPGAYHDWLVSALEYTKDVFFGEERLLFVNAWNEWGEGNHLEPDKRFGREYLRATKNATEGMGFADVERNHAPLYAPKQTAHRVKGLNIIGHIFNPTGRGEDARSVAKACLAAGVEFCLVNAWGDYGADRCGIEKGSVLRKYVAKTPRFDTNVLCINADEMVPIYRHWGRELFDSRYNIGYWQWELSHFPEAWNHAFDYLDELWAPATFVRDAFAANTCKPVRLLPLVVEPIRDDTITRTDLGLPEEPFLFLCFFDFTSWAARKNPWAALRAYEAFTRMAPESKAVLAIKVAGGQEKPEEYGVFRERVAELGNVVVLDRTYERDEWGSLISAADCLLALHRSGGFERGVAQAMYFGVPAVTTAYSANMDYTRSDNSYLVDVEMVAVKPGEYPHPDGQWWAEPRIDAAATHMLEIYAQRQSQAPEIAAKLAAAQRTIREIYSAEAVGTVLVDLIRQIESSSP